jgi:asparagine synthase (glutamine-hydrolysing)
MSIIFGIRKPFGATVTRDEIERLGAATVRYAPNGTALHLGGSVGMGFQPYATPQNSASEASESSYACNPKGTLLVVDGRLDNAAELRHCLQMDGSPATDANLILAAFCRWGENCFSRFIGDWSLALWENKNQTLYLARDHAGTRTLYFEDCNGTTTWSTYLETFFVEPRSIDIDSAYAARFLCAEPIRDLSPYKGIRSVLPGHFVAVRNDSIRTSSHWQWMSTTSIHYKFDREYEEHFLHLFEKSVERRHSDTSSTLAQLSGGMDSTSIVCVSDRSKRTRNELDILDTISFYDDSEPGWNEKPYFMAVENIRGKAGVHVNTSYRERSFERQSESEAPYLLPGADSSTIVRERKLNAALEPKKYQSILSGIGGDEVLGGVPSAEPELADYLVKGRLLMLMRRSLNWCLSDRTPLLHALPRIAKYTHDLYMGPHAKPAALPRWVTPGTQKLCTDITTRDVTRARRWGLRPSSISQGLAWWAVMESLPHNYPGMLSRPEYRYPYLDKELVDFLFSIPREQLLRPGRRRSLMRRALKGIVPDVVLERRRKGYQVRSPLLALHDAQSKIATLFHDARICQMGFVDQTRLQEAFESLIRTNEVKWWLPMVRAISFELFLRTLERKYLG